MNLRVPDNLEEFDISDEARDLLRDLANPVDASQHKPPANIDHISDAEADQLVAQLLEQDLHDEVEIPPVSIDPPETDSVLQNADALPDSITPTDQAVWPDPTTHETKENEQAPHETPETPDNEVSKQTPPVEQKAKSKSENPDSTQNTTHVAEEVETDKAPQKPKRKFRLRRRKKEKIEKQEEQEETKTPPPEIPVKDEAPVKDEKPDTEKKEKKPKKKKAKHSKKQEKEAKEIELATIKRPKRLVGAKNAARFFEQQAGRSAVPSMVFRSVVLLISIAAPPLVDFLIVKPGIASNNEKLAKIEEFRKSSAADAKRADALSKEIRRATRFGERLVKNATPRAEADLLVQSYIAALQRYGMQINKRDVLADSDTAITRGENRLLPQRVNLEMEGRFDVYVEIRRILFDEIKNISIVKEEILPIADSNNMRINVGMQIAILEDAG